MCIRDSYDGSTEPCWGPLVPEDGVCCASDKTCSITTDSGCSGTYYPSESSCTVGRCDDTVAGTCCVGANKELCSFVGGSQFCNGEWFGVGTGCEYCKGACCVPGNPAACYLTTNRVCQSGDQFLGPGTTCGNGGNVCGEGACCDELGGGCTADTIAALCLSPRTFLGVGDVCPAICPESGTFPNGGPCCIGASCSQVDEEASCVGTFGTVGAPCTGNTCFISGDGVSDGVGDGNDGGDGTDGTGSDGGQESCSASLHYF
eukprot:TRINITY_DN7079_c0_g2_i2.p1 TRINITY_DN7079_c0_g2~~TRINITY_DN7079_c0_g2_i2.p1  ORF type:complete len:260 (+),score=41.77 TRINITY_DN7079_c0_g2_i2:32-811(+)